MKKILYPISLAALAFSAACMPARADDARAVINTMEGYLEFVDYGGATIFPEQIPKDNPC